ncbi:hypothetical protein [Qipengyuania sp.]|uniref:hypothetical protein n=1 Tax=Qipengyuania sp. TaxID=2004515 RepID=UPI003BACF6E4
MNRPIFAIVGALGLLAAFLLGMMAYEQLAFGWPFAREESPLHTGWHWLRRSVNAVLCAALVISLARVRRHGEPLSPGALTLAWLVAALTAVATLLLVASPAAYARVGAEDSAIEWLSALLLFVAATAMAKRFLDLRRTDPATPFRRLHLLGAAGFALLFLLMGGEEVSWFQRQIGFATPDSVAARNWQGEFNLHNFQTDLTELVLYAGTGLFLMLLPLVRESALVRWPIVRPFAAFLPDRTVAAISAPMLVFTYSHWTLLPVQAAFWIGLFACIAFARSAASTRERALWSVFALWVALGQLLHLLLGHTMVMMYDSSEYRELFLCFGLAAYAFRQWRTGGRLTQT